MGWVGVALLSSGGCAPFATFELTIPDLSAARTRPAPPLEAPSIRGVAVTPRPSGGRAAPLRLDTDWLGLSGLAGSQSATCGSEIPPPRPKARPLVADCGPGMIGLGEGGYGFGTGGLGAGGGGIGMGVGLDRVDPAAALLERTRSKTQRHLDQSPWGWAVVDLPYRGGPPARFEIRPEATISERTEVTRDHLSTFAVDVDTAAYAIARRALVSGARPEPTLVRPEEMLNAFRYHYPQPRGLMNVHIDGARSPYDDDRYLLRVGVQAREVPEAERRPINLVFLIDTSCSMQGSDRLDLVKASLHIALAELGPADQVAITTYAGHVSVALPPTPADDIDAFEAALETLDAAGGTGMASGLQLAYDQAEAMHRPGTRTRVVVCSDGDANLGASTADALLETIADRARQGVALTTVGFGTGNYRDRVMETLANRGDGAYAYVDSPRQAHRVFGQELTRMVHEVARDVKIQVALDGAAVQAWRLVGYENRRLKDEEFMDDRVDAGDVGSGHQVTALYELALLPGATGRLGTVEVRAQPVDGGAIEHLRTEVDVRAVARPFEHASRDLRFASAVLGMAELLRQSPWAEGWPIDRVMEVAEATQPEQEPERAELMALLVSAQALLTSR